jgi:hypothetical protein
VPFGSFSAVSLRPLVNKSADDFSEKAEMLVSSELTKCIRGQFQGNITDSKEASLIIEPIIVQGKYVSPVQRVLWGASAGGSAVLLEVKFTDKDGIIADPTFYSHVTAWKSSMSYTFGGADEDAVAGVAQIACEYVQRNK